MAKAKKKTLPKNFEELLKAGDLAKLKEVFESCDPNARGGYSKQTALAFDACPDELASWLVAQGASLSATDTYGRTPLHSRARSWFGNIQGLLELGADVNSVGTGSGTPLHAAADSINVPNARLLIGKGAAVDARNSALMTPLECALHQCSNSRLEEMASFAECLLAAGASKTPAMQEFVEKLGKTFEFHRAGYNPETRDAASAALDRIYRMFNVVPVPRRAVHDGVAPIRVHGDSLQQQHQALWEFLVPSSGPAATVQGEVIRITGRIVIELDENGGINWDADYRRMADALLDHLRRGKGLSAPDMEEAAVLVDQLKRKAGDPSRMAELGVAWVALNPAPIKLDPPDYAR